MRNDLHQRVLSALSVGSPASGLALSGKRFLAAKPVAELILSAIIFVVAPKTSLSQTQTFIRDITYVRGPNESKEEAETVALYEVKRRLLEEVGTFIESTLEMTKIETSNGIQELTKSNIVSISAGITQTRILEDNWLDDSLYLKAAISVDPSDVREKLKTLLDIRGMAAQMEQLRKKAYEAAIEISQLRLQIAENKGQASNTMVATRYQQAVKRLDYVDLFQQAANLIAQGNHFQAIGIFNDILKVNPNDGLVYCARGYQRQAIGDRRGALSDYATAIRFGLPYPYSAIVFVYRSTIEFETKDYYGVVADMSNYIRIMPGDSLGYVYRGEAKYSMKDYRGAIEDYTAALRIAPFYRDVYELRGIAYWFMGNRSDACADLKRAVQMGARDKTTMEFMERFCQ